MRIEDEIVQKKFRNEYQKLAINLMVTHSWLTGKMNQILKKAGLSVQQYNLLRILRGQYPEPVSVNVIRERMIDKTSDASRLVERMRIKDLLERKECPSDRRKVEVKINDKGLDVLKKLDAAEAEIDKILSNISEKEAAAMSKVLDRLRD